MDSKVVVFLVYPEFKLLDLAGPLQVFSDAVDSEGAGAYHVVVQSSGVATVNSDTPASISVEQLVSIDTQPIDTLFVVGGRGVFTAMRNASLLESVNRLGKQSRRIASICNGAFLLAACGILDGRRAATHWEYCERLAREFPLVEVDSDSIFINDGNVWTSAGVTAGIDMALAMVCQDMGRSVGISLARSLVTYLMRPGGQSQFSEVLDLQGEDASGQFDELHKWILENLQQNLRVEELAHQVSMSVRNFSRVYQSRTGRTPAKAVEAIRVEAARRLLEQSKQPISTVAAQCGFGDEERMRRSFIRLLKISPQRYQMQFGP